MELKKYQRVVISDLSDYLALLPTMSAKDAFTSFWSNKGVPLTTDDYYHDTLPGVPRICVKVPTGGGKTFIAASAISTIFDSLPPTKTRAVVWLVPSDSILEQTTASLKSPHHPYRMRINMDFQHRVQVYEKSELLYGQNFSPASVVQQLSIFVLSYDSFRTSKKEGRKAYQENGYLAAFVEYFNDKSLLLADTDETALINVIRRLNPIIIVDESHHAVSTLSKEMLTNFNPALVLELTATPKKDANIISYVDAMQLKRENMVKLPVIVYNMRSKNDVIAEAITARRKLETEAKAEEKRTGRYIRPIALFQAEPKGKDDNTTFDKLKQELIDTGISENHIAIKTANVNELRGLDLMSKKCPIRYIITVNALKEGWDCPFAYILATVANRSSVVDVEQILGRVLRLPYATKNEQNTLNISYCLTSSADFHGTLKRVVAGLHNAGFSDRDYTAVDLPPSQDDTPEEATSSQDGTAAKTSPIQDDSSFDTPQSHYDTRLLCETRAADTVLNPTPETDEPTDIPQIINRIQEREQESDFFTHAKLEADAYDEHVAQQPETVPIAVEVRKKMNEFHISDEFIEDVKDLRLPQFVIPIDMPTFTGDKEKLLNPENLTQGGASTLKGKDATIDFLSIDAEIASIDIDGEKNIPKAWKLSGRENEFVREWFNSLPDKSKLATAKSQIIAKLDKNNALTGISEYVENVVGILTTEQLEDLQQSPHKYADKIRRKIDALLLAHREDKFRLWLEQGRITVQPMYPFHTTISPSKYTQTMPNSLYTSEEDMNDFEKDVVWQIANLPNIRWWHRNIAMKGFCINGPKRHYPDIIVMTQSGKVLLIETKGDHLENSESEQKCRIGREWEKLAGAEYRYYMVFKNRDLTWDGAVRFDRFLEIIKGL